MRTLAAAHWDVKPQRIMSATRPEKRKVCCLVGGRLEATSPAEVFLAREVWKDGPCRHVVLDVETRARVHRQCPDCTPPDSR